MDKKTFQETQKLYHYTSVCSAMKIIASKTLKFGKLKQMNDINEIYRGIFYRYDIDSTEIENELNLYCQISMVNDNTPRRGCFIPAMWGHYAEKGNGVCLVFDKEKFLSCLSKDMWRRCVQYNSDYDPSISVEDENIQNYFKTNKEKIFFTKTKDWAYEQEFRIVARKSDPNGELKLDFKDSLMATIFYFAEDIAHSQCVFNSVNVNAIEKIAPTLPILECGNFLGQDNLRDKDGSDWLKQDLFSEGWKLDG